MLGLLITVLGLVVRGGGVVRLGLVTVRGRVVGLGLVAVGGRGMAVLLGGHRGHEGEEGDEGSKGLKGRKRKRMRVGERLGYGLYLGRRSTEV